LGGGQLRVFSLYRQLARDFDVELVVLVDAGEALSDREIAPGLREIRVPKSPAHQESEARLAAEVGGIPVGDIGLHRFADETPEYGRQLARSASNAALIVASHPYALRILRPLRGRRPLVYEAHNVEYVLKRSVFEDTGSAGAKLVETVREIE